jgi:hypothetical protein
MLGAAVEGAAAADIAGACATAGATAAEVPDLAALCPSIAPNPLACVTSAATTPALGEVAPVEKLWGRAPEGKQIPTSDCGR